jgi:hypothetical protein
MKNQIPDKNHRKLIRKYHLLNIDLKQQQVESNLLHQNKHLINKKH